MAGDLDKQGSVPPIARTLDFYKVDASIITDGARHLLIKYAGIAREQVNDHVNAIRRKAFEIFPYPCIGMYRFLDLGLGESGIYDEIVQRLKGGDKFLDLGCCFGQEIRRLISDGVPAEYTYGSDLRREFVDLGYDLFQDRDREGEKINFLTANIFDDDSSLNELNGKISIVYTGSFFHLFNWSEQFDVAKRIVTILKPEPGVLLCGRQVGNTSPGEYAAGGYGGEKSRYRHDPKSWADFWDEVGEATNTKWKVDAVLDPFGVGFGDIEKTLTLARGEGGARRLRFVVRRV
jgi:hypothetical protein